MLREKVNVAVKDGGHAVGVVKDFHSVGLCVRHVRWSGRMVGRRWVWREEIGDSKNSLRTTALLVAVVIWLCSILKRTHLVSSR